MISASMLSEENAAWAEQYPDSGERVGIRVTVELEDSVMLNGREQYLILLSEKLDRHAGGQSGTRNDRISARGRLYPAESGF